MIHVCHSKFKCHFSTFVYVEAIFGIDLKLMNESYACIQFCSVWLDVEFLLSFLIKYRLFVSVTNNDSWESLLTIWFSRLESCFAVNQYFLLLTRMFPFISQEIGMGFIHFAVPFSKTFNWVTILSLLLFSMF